MLAQPELTSGSIAHRATAALRPQRLPVTRDGYVERTVVASDGVRLAVRDCGAAGARDHRGHGRSTGADMHTYRIDRLAADLADVLTVLHVTGPLRRS